MIPAITNGKARTWMSLKSLIGVPVARNVVTPAINPATNARANLLAIRNARSFMLF